MDNMFTIFEVFLILLGAWNIAVFAIYGIDKHKARRGKFRISEAALITMSLIMGGGGAIMGMVVFNHKTSKMKFRTIVPISVLENALVIALLYHYILGGKI